MNYDLVMNCVHTLIVINVMHPIGNLCYHEDGQILDYFTVAIFCVKPETLDDGIL